MAVRLGAHLPAIQTTALILAFIILGGVIPNKVYEKKVGKPMETGPHSLIMDMLKNSEGVVYHCLSDTIFCLVEACGWWLVGCPPLPIMLAWV